MSGGRFPFNCKHHLWRTLFHLSCGPLLDNSKNHVWYVFFDMFLLCNCLAFRACVEIISDTCFIQLSSGPFPEDSEKHVWYLYFQLSGGPFSRHLQTSFLIIIVSVVWRPLSRQMQTYLLICVFELSRGPFLDNYIHDSWYRFCFNCPADPFQANAKMIFDIDPFLEGQCSEIGQTL